MTAQPPPRLTPRQCEILHLLAAGLTRKEMAARLDLSLLSVDSIHKDLYKTLAARGRYEVLCKAKYCGLITGFVGPPKRGIKRIREELPTHKFQVKLDHDLLTRLDRLANSQGMSRQELAARILEVGVRGLEARSKP